MPVADRLRLAARLQALERELADGFEHPVAWLIVGCFDPQQALVDERAQAIEHVLAQLLGRSSDHLRILEPAATDEHGEPLQESPARLVEQVVTPGDRAAERALSLRQVARAAGEQVELVPQPGEDGRGRQAADARRGELDGQRHPAQAGADPGHRIGVVGGQREVGPDAGRARHEQADRGIPSEGFRITAPLRIGQPLTLQRAQARRVGWHAQPADRVFLLARDAQHGPARADDGELGQRPQQVRDVGGRIDQLLEVVEHEEDGLPRERVRQGVEGSSPRRLGDAQSVRDGREDQRRVGDVRQWHEPDAPWERLHHVPRELERQARLAGPAGTGEREQPAAQQQLAGFVELALATHERRELRGQVVGAGVQRPDRREVRAQPGDRDVPQPLRLEVLEAMLPQRPERDALGQHRLHGGRRRPRQHDLPAVSRGRHPRRAMDIGPDVQALRVEHALARVEPHPHPDGRRSRPRLGAQRPLRVDHRVERRRSVGEHREEPVALDLELLAAVRGERCPDQLPVPRQDGRPARGAEGLDQAGRALDVGEQERDLAGGTDRRRHRPGPGSGAGRGAGHGTLPASLSAARRGRRGGGGRRPRAGPRARHAAAG